MFESLLIYSLLALCMILCGNVAAQRSCRYVGGSGIYQDRGTFFTPEIIILLLSFAFVFGCRWGVGRDYFRYLLSYTGEIPVRWDFLFLNISRIIKNLGCHYSVFFGFWAFADVFLLYYAVRRFKFIYPYLAFFLIFGSFYLPMMNTIRQEVAAGVFLLSIYFVDKKKIVGFIICCVIAVMLHKLSMILFIAYPLLRVGKNWFDKVSVQLLLYAFAIFIHYNGDILIRWIETPFEFLTGAMDYEQYQYETLLEAEWDSRNRFGNNTGLGIVANLLKNIPIIIFSKQLKDYYKSSYFNLLYVLFFISAIFLLLFGNSIILNRVNYFLGYFQVIVYSFYAYFCFNIGIRKFRKWGMLLMLIQIPLFINIISNNASTAQYSFYWENNYETPDVLMLGNGNVMMLETDDGMNIWNNGMNATGNGLNGTNNDVND